MKPSVEARMVAGYRTRKRWLLNPLAFVVLLGWYLKSPPFWFGALFGALGLLALQMYIFGISFTALKVLVFG